MSQIERHVMIITVRSIRLQMSYECRLIRVKEMHRITLRSKIKHSLLNSTELKEKHMSYGFVCWS